MFNFKIVFLCLLYYSLLISFMFFLVRNLVIRPFVYVVSVRHVTQEAINELQSCVMWVGWNLFDQHADFVLGGWNVRGEDKMGRLGR
jgi:hypothetical protein